MSKESQLRQVLDCGIVAVVRSPDSQQLVEVCRALADGGVSVVEITMTVPGALDVVRQVRQALGDRLLLGAGTVLDPETARAALLAGAEYLVAPTLNRDVIRLCRRYDKLVMPGAFTPTEILAAWEAGADIVKVFPAEVVGPAFFKALRGPLPQIRLMPTGGVDLTTAAAFLKSGACCLGVGSQLVEPAAGTAGNFDRLRHLANRGIPVKNLLFAKPDELSQDTAAQWHIVQQMKLPAQLWAGEALDERKLADELRAAEWVVDALFGTGLKGPMRSPFDRIAA